MTMRYVTVVIETGDNYLHPIGKALSEEDGIQREAVHEYKLLNDGTVVIMGEISGDLNRYREILENESTVVDYTVSGNGEGVVYSRFEANEQIKRLLKRQKELELVIEMPIEITEDGGHRVTFVGDEKSFQELDSYPDNVGMRVEEVGEYHPAGTRRLVSRLTDRQKEILELAVKEGYYKNPREITHRQLAEILDLSPGTVGEHLRKIEKKVFSEMLPH